MPSIFLSYTHADKAFARRITQDLVKVGVRVWIDEGELEIGDSLIERIRQAIDDVEYVGVVLSPRSVNSPWVAREVDIAMNHEIEGKRVKVLPLLIEECEPPSFIKGKVYADFRDSTQYEDELAKVIRRLGIKTSPASGIKLLGKKERTLYLINAFRHLLDRGDRLENYRIRISAVTSSFSLAEDGVQGDPEHVRLLIEEARSCRELLAAGVRFSCLLYPRLETMRAVDLSNHTARARLTALSGFLTTHQQSPNLEAACAPSRPGNQFILGHDVLVEAYTHTARGGYDSTSVITDQSLIGSAIDAFDRDFSRAIDDALRHYPQTAERQLNWRQAAICILLGEVANTLELLQAHD